MAGWYCDVMLHIATSSRKWKHVSISKVIIYTLRTWVGFERLNCAVLKLCFFGSFCTNFKLSYLHNIFLRMWILLRNCKQYQLQHYKTLALVLHKPSLHNLAKNLTLAYTQSLSPKSTLNPNPGQML